MDISSAETLKKAVDTFWEAFPSFWNQIRAHIREVAVQQFNISVEQFHILRHIRMGRGSVSELAEAKNISRPAISQAVDSLVNRGLILRTPNAQDRRYVQLDLTIKGNALLDAVFENTYQWMMQMLSPLGKSEIETLIHSFEILKNISSK